MYFINMLMMYFILILLIMIGIAYFTLLERKILSYIQIRKGPNKVGYLGILQPFSDAIKLFSKETVYLLMMNYLYYYMSPILILSLMLLIWIYLPMLMTGKSFNLLGIICIIGMMSYPLILCGWSAMSKYGILGSLRSVAQIISYEVSMMFIIFSMIFLLMSFSFLMFIEMQYLIWNLCFCFMFLFGMLVSSLAETNRSPFDFSEGESELVSGFNIEYSSWGFSFIFLGEYGMIMFMSFMISFIFLGANLWSILFYMKVFMLMFFWVWSRGTLPRFRYDKLMYLAWKKFLPFFMNFMFMYLILKMIFYILN